MDLEGFAKRCLREDIPEADIISEMSRRIIEIKKVPVEYAERLAAAVLEEARTTLRAGEVGDPLGVLCFEPSGVKMGEFGVGSRGLGDFFVHEKIAEIIGRTSAVVDSSSLSDSGVVQIGNGGTKARTGAEARERAKTGEGGESVEKSRARAAESARGELKYLVVTVDGMHSRLSDFPFLAGFHVARAALRDVFVMAAEPVALFSDIHVADDGDVAKIFEHVAGISVVAELSGVPLVTGSTLRIGGDLVIGERMTGCVGAVGVADFILTRKNAKESDVILMTEGSGGGTVATAALYHGDFDIVYETLNLKFINACKALLHDADVINALKSGRIHVMTDVTNGGVRGDAHEIAKVSGVKLVFYEENIRKLTNPKVLEMLERHHIDYLGVSLDALLVICEEAVADDVKRAAHAAGVKTDVVGFVERGKGAELIIDGRRTPFVPRFRESAYTPVKKVVGEYGDFERLKPLVEEAARRAAEKKRRIMEFLRQQHEGNVKEFESRIRPRGV